MIPEADWQSFWFAMALHLTLAGFFVSVIAGIDGLVLRAGSARTRCHLWSAALVSLCVPAAWVASLAGPLLDDLLKSPSATRIGAGGVGLRELFQPSGAVAAPPNAIGPDLWTMVTGIWIGGAVLLAWALMRRDRRTFAPACTPAGADNRRLAAAAEMGSIPERHLEVVPEFCAPHARGVLRPKIVVPRTLVERLTSEELLSVLLHEHEHLRRRDPLRRVAYRAVLLALWFFPLTWLVLRRLHRASELVCDDAVLRHGVAPAIYARALARTLEMGLGQQPALGAGLLGSAEKGLRHRLQRLHTPTPEDNMRRTLFAFSIVAATLAATVVAAHPQTASPAQAGTQDDSGRVVATPIGYEELLALAGVGTSLPDVERTGSLRATFDFLGDVGGFEVRLEDFDPEWLSTADISWAVTDLTVGQVLVSLSQVHGLAYEVASNHLLIVRPVLGQESNRRKAMSGDGGQPPRPDGPRRVGGVIRAPELVHHVEPTYTPLARQAGLEGVVIAELVINQQGEVDEVRLLRGLGLGLDEAAVQAMRQWRYTPTAIDGEVVPVLLTVTVHFSIPDERE